ncbi:MAG: putative manganese-dependent inorganic diphosphatase [Spirochaetaceae bacterium]|jgi:manganese-dependent inorganic pyrophosphatase|nr:putative manganese-dependent inorganic diphosphatase [Spirochaetaceae bacterium]
MSPKSVYIVGHRNPDTDSIVAAAAYARLKQLLGKPEYAAIRAGKVLPQTEYIFDRFKVPVPQYIPDMIPKVGYFMSTEVRPVLGNTSLWNAVAEMEARKIKVIPVVNADGAYSALLNYNAFAQNILRAINPETATTMQTNIRLIGETLSAQTVFSFDEESLFKCVPIAASDTIPTFKETLALHTPENAVIVTGDREDVQEYAIECGVRALILSSGNQMDKELRKKAEKKKVSVLMSPYRTAETVMLVMYSAPASTMADTEVKPVHVWDPIRHVRPLLAESTSRALPVVDDAGTFVGLIAENDLLNDPNVELILVDHNEASQAPEGVEHYMIQEIIDHHRLGNIKTKMPITVINRPVGATCTIIVSLYKQNRVPIPKEIASILLCGILADTLGLQSATTTDEDRDTAEFLTNITDLDIEKLTRDIQKSASRIGDRAAIEVIHQDLKDYTENGVTFTVSQIEVDTAKELLSRKEEFLAALEKERIGRDALFSALMVTDVSKLKSNLLIAAKGNFLSLLEFPRREEGVYFLGDIVSRKKQLLPLLTEQLSRLK